MRQIENMKMVILHWLKIITTLWKEDFEVYDIAMLFYLSVLCTELWHYEIHENVTILQGWALQLSLVFIESEICQKYDINNLN